MPKCPIAIDELLTELERIKRASSTEDGGVTTSEILDATGWSKHSIARILHEAVKAGRWECLRAKRPAIDGVMRWVPVYRPARKGKKGKRG